MNTFNYYVQILIQMWIRMLGKDWVLLLIPVAIFLIRLIKNINTVGSSFRQGYKGYWYFYNGDPFLVTKQSATLLIQLFRCWRKVFYPYCLLEIPLVFLSNFFMNLHFTEWFKYFKSNPLYIYKNLKQILGKVKNN